MEGRDVQDEVLVGEVPAGGRVGQQQMLTHHERRELAGGRLDPHPLERLDGYPGSDGHVPPFACLPDVVEQRTEQRSGFAVGVRRARREVA